MNRLCFVDTSEAQALQICIYAHGEMSYYSLYMFICVEFQRSMLCMRCVSKVALQLHFSSISKAIYMTKYLESSINECPTRKNRHRRLTMAEWRRCLFCNPKQNFLAEMQHYMYKYGFPVKARTKIDSAKRFYVDF